MRVILFRTTERLVSEAPWYEGGYRAQIVAYAVARLAALAWEQSAGGTLDHQRLWTLQAAGGVLENQLLVIAERMARVLRNPPMAGQNISEWAKQQACRKVALEAEVPAVDGLDAFLLPPDEARAAIRDARNEGRIDNGFRAVRDVMSRSAASWITVRDYARKMRILGLEDERALFPVITTPPKVPTDRQAERLMTLLARCAESGLSV